jgi:hypothetical protein
MAGPATFSVISSIDIVFFYANFYRQLLTVMHSRAAVNLLAK